MVKPIVSAINNLKTMGGGHAVHERQAILSTTVVISHRAAACDVTGGVASLNFDATELQIF